MTPQNMIEWYNNNNNNNDCTKYEKVLFFTLFLYL